MPSKKKKPRGKARRAAKSRKELSNDNEVKQDEVAVLEEAINLAAAERKELEEAARNNDNNNKVERCNHGFVPWPKGHVCGRFVQSFVREFKASNGNAIECFADAFGATSTKYAAVWRDQGMLKHVISYFLAEGAGAIIEEKDDLARQYAVVTISFEQYIDAITGNNNVLRNCGKKYELSSENCDEHTLVSFFRKRMPCKCLNERYKQVKSIVKMGSCCNPDCPLPDGKTEYSKLMHCEQCRVMTYCSIECQKANWPSHKECCVALHKILE